VLTDQQLFDTQLSVILLCQRSKGGLRNKHRIYVCGLTSILAVEANNRGKPSPQWPYKA
jgi:hypothetical protein